MDVPAVIRDLDLGWLEKRVAAATEWPPERVRAACEEYRKYLAIRHSLGPELVAIPWTDVDEVWHHHILDTRRYAADCVAIFGTFLHHDPGLDAEAVRVAWDATRQAYAEHFEPRGNLGEHPLGHCG